MKNKNGFGVTKLKTIWVKGVRLGCAKRLYDAQILKIEILEFWGALKRKI